MVRLIGSPQKVHMELVEWRWDLSIHVKFPASGFGWFGHFSLIASTMRGLPRPQFSKESGSIHDAVDLLTIISKRKSVSMVKPDSS